MMVATLYKQLLLSLAAILFAGLLLLVGLLPIGSAIAAESSPNQVSASSQSATTPGTTIRRSHALALYDDIKYPANFKHFDYSNPAAPKGGSLKMAVVSSSGFDSLNPFIVKGISADGVGSLVYQTLAVQSYDEPFTQYGLIAESFEYPEDRSWIIFHINPNARFHDGHAIDAEDVVFSFNLLIEQGAPLFSAYYAGVKQVEALDERRVKFSFEESENRELPLIVTQLAILPAHYWEDREFNKSSLEPPLGSGPYRVDKVDPGRSVSYQRVENWWAAKLAVVKGKYNFEQISYDYYRDKNVAIEALKAGEYDLRLEGSAKSWATSYTGDAFDRGDILKEKIADHNPDGMQAFALNSRRPPLDNPLVREALSYAFDFEWANRQLFYGQYQRTQSYFSGSELASSGLPSGEELALLNLYRDKLPERVFTAEYRAPSTSDAGGFRANLRTALKLLKEAGWVTKNGQLVNSDGQQMQLELLYYAQDWEKIIQPFAKNMRRMGIDASLRLVDTHQFVERMNRYDFDITTITIGQSSSPGNEQRGFWSSESADIDGGRNYTGVKDPVVDELVELLIQSSSREQLIQRTRALDRVLLWGHYVVPQWRYGFHRLIYHNKFEQPAIRPLYSNGIWYWWAKQP